jgi:hypothetical protein
MLWLEYEMSPQTYVLSTWLLALVLFWEILETLGSGALLESWGSGASPCLCLALTPSWIPFFMLSAMPSAL